MKKVGKERLKSIWYGMRDRCYNHNNIGYKNYGGKGVRICEEWLSDKYKFIEWALNNGYSDDLTIDRINNDGNYCPENCRWVDRRTQANNSSLNTVIEFMGEKKTLTQWCEHFGVSRLLFYERYHERGYSFEKAMFSPKMNVSRRLYTINGVTKNLYQWCKEYGMEYNRVYKRLDKGYDIITALKNENLRTNGDMFKKRKERRGGKWNGEILNQ